MTARYRRSLLTITALAAAIGALPAGAQQKARPAPQQMTRAAFVADMTNQFQAIDTNKDGVLTREEIEQFQRNVFLTTARARNRAIFAQLDTNKDGQISVAEFAQLVPANPQVSSAQMLARMDSNHDGRISRAEHTAGSAASFEKADANHDGVITQAELRAFAQSMAK